ncbi:MAG: hypothetical protein HY784_18570, partial [Chloroflexi bacterium]|nr:hypothetical protein [Chloroflexota bacterium]
MRFIQQLPATGDRPPATGQLPCHLPGVYKVILTTEMTANWGYTRPLLSHEIGQLPGLYPTYRDVGYARDAFKTLVIGQTLTQIVPGPPGLLMDGW